ncbi:ATP-binding protein, partial [Streptomyces sp. T-3]|nr:ATP-binding protein [Streptomyces sp. T-3]
PRTPAPQTPEGLNSAELLYRAELLNRAGVPDGAESLDRAGLRGGAEPPDRAGLPARAGYRSLVLAAVLGVLLVGGAFGWYAYSKTHAVLLPRDYVDLRVGDSREQLRLPDRDVADPPTDRAPALPAGASCVYYRASGELFVSVDHFRLCFDGDRLVAKDRIPAAGRAEHQ